MFNQIEQPDFYVERMKDTLRWIDEKRNEVLEEQRKNPAGKYESRLYRGYNCGIVVDADWLYQLVLEAVGKHCQIQQSLITAANITQMQALSRPIVFEPTAMTADELAKKVAQCAEAKKP